MRDALKLIDEHSRYHNGYSSKYIKNSIAKEAVKMAAQSNCKCSPEETTGAMQEWVCNTCGRVQENENIK